MSLRCFAAFSFSSAVGFFGVLRTYSCGYCFSASNNCSANSSFWFGFIKRFFLGASCPSLTNTERLPKPRLSFQLFLGSLAPSSLQLAGALTSHFSITFFRWLEATQERRGRRVKGARSERVHRSAAQTLDSAPALRTLPAEKMGRFPPLLCFQHVYARSPPRLPTTTRSRGFFFLAACFLQVRAR
jgi:hypothetical protein